MITVIAGTNRKGSITKAISQQYHDLLSQVFNGPVKHLALEDIPHDWFNNDMYTEAGMSASLMAIQDEYILPAQGFVFLCPEYNGSISGSLKLFIDACSVRHYADNFKGKKAALVGVASGRAGNLAGLAHLATMLNYLGTTTLPNRLPLSGINQLLDDKQQITDTETLATLQQHAIDFAKLVSKQ